ncbi:MAG: hypothetical protein K1X64_15105 [Myxococcaceae bacterium]|nr:hypothetical protein [Myxococcaceae bacterium]
MRPPPPHADGKVPLTHWPEGEQQPEHVEGPQGWLLHDETMTLTYPAKTSSSPTVNILCTSHLRKPEPQ